MTPSLEPEVDSLADPPRPESSGMRPAFDAVYEATFDFVWRTAARLGVGDASLDDVAQEVFLVVHRRLADFEQRSSLKTWVYGITRRVVSDQRKRQRREARAAVPIEELWSEDTGPQGKAEKGQAALLLHALLQTLDEEQREVFVLAELEQLTAPEIAEATGANVNTVYWRLREARAAFERALARHHARERGRTP